MLVPYSWFQILWYFYIYGFLGWCSEVAFAAVAHGKFVNRGFVNGPICSIYGFGVMSVLLVLGPLKSSFWLLFGGSVLFTKFQGLFTRYLKGQLNDLLVKIVVSMSVDNNCPDDNDKTILLEGSSAQVRLLPVTGSSAAVTQAYVQGSTATVFLTSRQLRTATNAQSGATVTVNATDPAADTVILAGRSIANARSAGVAALQVQLTAGTVTLDSDALAALDLHKDVALSLIHI